MEIIIIAALSENNVIGNKGQIPWHSKEELQRFKKTTMGFPIIMGRKTFESIGKPLKGRLNIVISRQDNYMPGFENVQVFNSLKSSLKFCEDKKNEKVFIIGGGQIYKDAVKLADTLLITRMKLNVDGDTFFPDISPDIWQTDSIEPFTDFDIIKLVRI